MPVLADHRSMKHSFCFGRSQLQGTLGSYTRDSECGSIHMQRKNNVYYLSRIQLGLTRHDLHEPAILQLCYTSSDREVRCARVLL